MNQAWLSFFKKAAIFFTFLYVITLTCSMAGMEITSWASVFFFILYFIFNLPVVKGRSVKSDVHGEVRIHSTGVELILVLFVGVVAAGLAINGPPEDFIFSMGMLRNLALFFSLTYTLSFFKNLRKLLLLMGSFATVIAIYGIWQHYSGIDLWRHNNRALVMIPWGSQARYATVGFFNHHLTFGHSYMMILCLPWAALLLSDFRKRTWLKTTLLSISFVAILTSLVFTYGRGVWIAVLFTIPFMTFIVNRKFFIYVALVLAILGGVMLKFDTDFRTRAASVFAEKYKSNDERKKLWEANIEMFKDHPLVGVGYHQNEALSMSYYQKMGIQSGMAGHAHNNYIQMLSTTGAIGFILYVLFIGFFFILTLRLYFFIPKENKEDRILTLAALGAQFALHIGGMTQWNFGDMKVQHQYIFWLACVSCLSYKYKLRLKFQEKIINYIVSFWQNILNKIRPWFEDPYLPTVWLVAFVMVAMKKWEPGGNLDTIWYSAVAKNIYLTGNYFHFFISKFYFKEIFDHMPMDYWIIGTIFHIFGPSDFAARLYPMLCSFFSYLLIYKIGIKIKNQEFGLLAVVVHALCFGASKWNGAVMHDVPLTTFYLASFYFFIKGLDRPKNFYFTSLFFALGVFTKGPIIFGFFLGMAIWSYWDKNHTFFKQRHFYGALFFLMCLLMLPLLPMFSFGSFNIYTMFLLWKSNYVTTFDWSRVLAYFVVVLQTSTLTVIPYLLAPFLMKHETDFLPKSLSILRFAFFISVSIIVPLSFFAVKFPHYLLPFYPFLSLVATYAVWKLYQTYRLPWSLTKICQVTAIGAVLIFVSLPIKTTGKRSKEVLNLVNLIKLDHDIAKKDVYFFGHYSDDMTIFQTFKFYGSIDLKSVNLDKLKDIDLSKAYLIVKHQKLPLNYKGAHFDESQCVAQNVLYCVIASRQNLLFDIPEYLFPHETY
jgi:O-antigen ligase